MVELVTTGNEGKYLFLVPQEHSVRETACQWQNQEQMERWTVYISEARYSRILASKYRDAKSTVFLLTKLSKKTSWRRWDSFCWRALRWWHSVSCKCREKAQSKSEREVWMKRVWHVYQFPGATVTKYHNWAAKTTEMYSSTVLEARSPKTKVLAGVSSFQELWGRAMPCLFPSFW